MVVPPRVCIISPALADANNGNWHTARRWSAALHPDCQVEVRTDWMPETGSNAAGDRTPDLLIALHARRSAAALARFVRTGRPSILVLTGTDLYRDLPGDIEARRSVRRASRLVVLNDRGLDALPAAARTKASVIVQSAPIRPTLPPRLRTFDTLLVGHLRAEKDPLTAIRALARLPDPRLRLIQVGAATQAELGEALAMAARSDPRIELRGPLPHPRTRRLIARGRVLLLPSIMEGGANVAIEAITSGVPVLASRIEGTVGLLGESWPAYFPVGDDAALAALIARCQGEPGFLEGLRRRCAVLAPRFAPEREAQAVCALVHNLLDASSTGRTA